MTRTKSETNFWQKLATYLLHFSGICNKSPPLRLQQVLIKPKEDISSALVAWEGGLLSLVNIKLIIKSAHPPWPFDTLVTGMGYPQVGPSKASGAPSWGPMVSHTCGKNCKSSQKLYKSCTCIKVHQIITITPILSLFGLFSQKGLFLSLYEHWWGV